MRSKVATSAMLLSILASPSPAIAQRAGTLISADPIVETPDGMQAWKVTYWTASGNGQPIQATGIVAAPREAKRWIDDRFAGRPAPSDCRRI